MEEATLFAKNLAHSLLIYIWKGKENNGLVFSICISPCLQSKGLHSLEGVGQGALLDSLSTLDHDTFALHPHVSL